jgi:hypothetical protein
MKIMLGDVNAKVGRENIFKPTIGNERLHEISNDNGVTVVNFTTSKKSVKSSIFSHRNIRTFSSTSLMETQIDHILIDRRRYSSILDVRSFRAEDCDTDHYLVMVNLTERDWQ